jgi:hypothetical protein
MLAPDPLCSTDIFKPPSLTLALSLIISLPGLSRFCKFAESNAKLGIIGSLLNIVD